MIPVENQGGDGGRALYILRHGETFAAKGGKRYIGRTDTGLSDVGHEQARKWARWFKDISLGRILCSDLQRASATAAVIGRSLGITPVVQTALREIDLGVWEGLTFGEVRDKYPAAFEARGRDPAGYRPSGGESFRDLQQRVVTCMAAFLERESGNILLVGHAGVNRVLLCHLLDLPLGNLFRLGQDHAGLSIVVPHDRFYRLQRLNMVL